MSRRRGTVTARLFAADTLEVARRLIGMTLLHRGAGGVIVEAEAYKDDEASHYQTRRPTAGRLMGTTHARIYIYRIYGIHLCLNFTADANAPGAVLLRALQPTHGLSEMRARRGVGEGDDRRLLSGPGKLAQALAIDPDLNGEPVLDHFTLHPPPDEVAIEATPRIGIRKATGLPWRFVHKGSRYLSR